MSSVEFDFSELDALAVEIENAAPAVGRNVQKAIAVAARKGKTAWSRSAGSHRYMGPYPGSIDFDPVAVTGAGVIETELGPNLAKNAGLGIVEESAGGVRGTPQRNYLPAVAIMQEDLARGVLLAVGDDGLGGA